ncbi:MAG: MBL fold metallo-hydrolase [Patescibacteria group bacterium]|nr:MBL fold metallo-hydrolase [Patescibacteria group bacterium]
MILTYLGHSAFKLKGKKGVVVTDPYSSYVGMNMPSVSADIVTVSHHHPDHSASSLVSGTARRKNPFLITQAGEYEVGGLSVFGVETKHDDQGGVERGDNIVYTVLIDELRVCHLGDLGHELSSTQIEAIGSVDILLCPVGGVFTINPDQAVKVIRSLEPSIVLPMHYRSAQHDAKVFGELATVDDFVRVYGRSVAVTDKLEISRSTLPEETELCLLTAQTV